MKIVNKDNTINKTYAKKIWNHVTEANIDSFNEDIDFAGFVAKMNEFEDMLNAIVKESKSDKKGIETE